MKTTSTLLYALSILMIIGLCAAPGVSAADYVTQGVSVNVSSELSIAASASDISLNFADYASGTNSSTQDITYTVSCNNMIQGDGSLALKAKLDSLYTNIDFKADPGTYTKSGGNTELVEASSGFITVGTTDTALANKGNSTGDGKVLDGTIAVTYMATATDDLASGPQGNRFLDVVLVNI